MCDRLNAVRLPDAVRIFGAVVVWLFACVSPAAEPPKPLAVLKGHTEYVACVAFSPDCKTVASASTDRTIRLWDAASGKEQFVLKTGKESFFAIAFSPDGKTLATGGLDGPHLWDLTTRKRTTPDRENVDAEERIISVAFSPDGKTVVYAGVCQNRLELWDAATGKCTVKLKRPEDVGGYHVVPAFTADGRGLVTCDSEGRVEIWDVATGKRGAGAKADRNAYPVALAPDGKTLVTREDADDRWLIRLRDAVTGKEVAQFGTQTDRDLRFSRDGKTLAAGDGTITVWDAATGKRRAQFRPDGFAQLLAVNSDGTALATRDWENENVIALWDVRPPK